MTAPPEDVNARLRRLPKVDEVLRGDVAQRLLERAPRWAVVAAIRAEIEALRARLRAGDGEVALDGERLGKKVDELVLPSLRPVVNATGVVLHTNLGRAPIARAALDRVVEVARGYCNLEYVVDERRRGSRHDHAATVLRELTGADEGLVVNNCAAAVLLSLATLAAGREVIVSRGELVEIGGSFRVPDVMRASGARLVEVGTTNRTHARDYERAITPDTALLLKVHRSNFAVVGFTTEVSTEELAAIAHARGLPLMVDLGSGSLVPTRSLGLGDEPTVQQTVAAGADVVTFSGDKLLGGPQAGVLLCKSTFFPALKSHPMLRALRPGKLDLAALTATLELYRDGREREVPGIAMLGAPRALLEARARRLADLVGQVAPRVRCAVVETRSAVGGGALPTDEPPSFALSVALDALDAGALEARLRAHRPPVIGRIAEDRLLLDVRTVMDDELDLVAGALAAIAGDGNAHGNGHGGRPSTHAKG